MGRGGRSQEGERGRGTPTITSNTGKVQGDTNTHSVADAGQVQGMSPNQLKPQGSQPLSTVSGYCPLQGG